MHVDMVVMVCSLQIGNTHVPQRCVVNLFFLMGQYLQRILGWSSCDDAAIISGVLSVTAAIFLRNVRDKVGLMHGVLNGEVLVSSISSIVTYAPTL